MATTGVRRKPYEWLHIMFYTRRSTHVRFISCDEHQLYDFKGRGVDLEVEGVRFIEMHRGDSRAANVLGPPPSRGGDLELEIFVGTLHCALENGADLYVNERQKIGHYRTTSTGKKNKNHRVGSLYK